MSNLVSRVPLQDLKMVVTAILIQKESGGNLAEVLDKVAYVIRERFRLKKPGPHAHRAGTHDRMVLTFPSSCTRIRVVFHQSQAT